MQHSHEQIAADTAALAAHRCPETGRDLKPLNAAALRTHIALTFPHADDPTMVDSDHARRARALRAYLAERFKEEQ